ncbi:ABC transporter substrate-binding protein [Fodinisporobacter ferrooxydans]|uniref:ABC transporter substrate-binding protein n=1 Tax=Fodinisporobacter ferrooxydans TaxID=2901836 RepID=A0ABY4CHU9_9BACL|nr:ABC transporter substrate-binding protein [Alicyclobacillaceae bacterium MYW30-H2]
MNIKKTLVIGSILSLGLGVVGCGDKATSTNTNHSQTVEFWYALPGASGQVVQKLVQQFNETHKDIRVNATFIPTNERLQKLTAALGTGDPPDLYTAGPPEIGQLQGSNQIVSISDLTSGKLSMDTFFPALRSVAGINKKLWAMPVSAGVIALYYNKDLFQKAGISTPPKTWNEMIQDTIKLTNHSKGQYGIVLPTSPDIYTTSVWQCFLWENGGHLLTPDRKKAVFNSKEGVEALQLWVDLVHKYKVAPLKNLNEIINMQTFGTGQVGMVPAMPLFVETASKFPFQTGTAIMPSEKIKSTTLGGWYLIIPNKSKHQQAAKTFLEWLHQPQNGAKWNIGTGSIPTDPNIYKSGVYQDYVKKTPLVKPFVDEMDYAKAPPAIKQYAQISKLIAIAINNALYQKETPKQALDEAAQKANRLLEGK